MTCYVRKKNEIKVATFFKSTGSQGDWGRAWKVGLITLFSSAAILLLSPFVALFFFISAFYFNCSLLGPLTTSPLSWWRELPPFSWAACGFTLGWLGFQILLASLPDFLHLIFKTYRGGIRQGSVTPAGNQLSYNINGLQAWVISHIVFILGAFYFEWFRPSVLFDNWGSIFIMANVIGWSLAFFVYLKAYRFPSYVQDRKFSGNRLYDFYMGIELNPRLGNLDLKLFFNGRPGIVAWTIINLSFAAAQYNLYGAVSNSMWLVNFLQALYVLYFFWKEAWYINTIDIHHDHFGWMLAWGDCVWLPFMYTLQALFLVFHPVELSTGYAFFVLSLGLIGFWIFVSANNQKDRFRLNQDKTLIWGKPAQSLLCEYTTRDGEKRQSSLLTSGWWGIGRHMNYTGDLILSLAYSLACGVDYLFPYFYFVFMTILLVHRCLRDEHRCLHKYGKAWETYCAHTPYRLIPKVF